MGRNLMRSRLQRVMTLKAGIVAFAGRSGGCTDPHWLVPAQRGACRSLRSGCVRGARSVLERVSDVRSSKGNRKGEDAAAPSGDRGARRPRGAFHVQRQYVCGHGGGESQDRPGLVGQHLVALGHHGGRRQSRLQHDRAPRGNIQSDDPRRRRGRERQRRPQHRGQSHHRRQHDGSDRHQWQQPGPGLPGRERPCGDFQCRDREWACGGRGWRSPEFGGDGDAHCGAALRQRRGRQQWCPWHQWLPLVQCGDCRLQRCRRDRRRGWRDLQRGRVAHAIRMLHLDQRGDRRERWKWRQWWIRRWPRHREYFGTRRCRRPGRRRGLGRGRRGRQRGRRQLDPRWRHILRQQGHRR